MQAVKGAVAEQAENAFERALGLVSPPPPAPPPPWPPGMSGMDEEPDASSFIGAIVFFISFASSFTDLLESENCAHMFSSEGRRGGVFASEYFEFPVYNALALGVGSVSYFLAFFGYGSFELNGSGHILMTGLMFLLFVRHLGKLNDLSRRRINTLCGLAVTPFITLSFARAERIKFRSCKMLTLVLATIATLPLGALFRDYKGAVYEPRVSKLRRRLLFLFMILFLYIVISMPFTVCSRKLLSVGHSNVLLAFDLSALLIGSDSVWA